MITGKFHSHITIHPETEEQLKLAEKLIQGKLTFIDLKSDSDYTDHMVTNHYVTGFHVLTDHNSIITILQTKQKLLEDSGIKVLRVKLEHELLDKRSTGCEDESLENALYTEVHLKVSGDFSNYHGWAWSTNSKDGSTFLTKRYFDKSYSVIEQDLVNCYGYMKDRVLETKVEAVLFDSNPSGS